MDVQKAYNIWADKYDSNLNKTRDLEGFALRDNLHKLKFNSCLEIGCGTGKNTEWLLTKSNEILAVDLSDKMLAAAKEKIKSEKVNFVQADINQIWEFTNKKFDIITFSLVLEHIENLDFIFQQAAKFCNENGIIYVGELHPYKQYSGTKARFETKEGLQIVNCFNHNISDFVLPAKKYGFEILDIKEYFDDNDRNSMPRILVLIFRKIKTDF